MANIELPKDADGNEVPLDTTVLYDNEGDPYEISHFVYYPRCKIPEDAWSIVYGPDSDFYKRISHMHLNPPDSWEKINEDFDRCIQGCSRCMYYDKNCGCRKYAMPINRADDCFSVALADFQKRIGKLRDEEQ